MAEEDLIDTPTGKSVAEIRTRYRVQCVDNMAETAQNVDKSFCNDEGRKQHKLDRNGWTGDLFDQIGLKKAFSREENAEDVRNAIKDPKKPGTVGDLMVSGLQGDRLACFERAFRLSNSSRIRLSLHAAARRRGHGHDAGVFKRGEMRYLMQLLGQSKEGQT